MENETCMAKRKAVLDELETFEKEAELWINNELEKCGWTYDHLLNKVWYNIGKVIDNSSVIYRSMYLKSGNKIET